MQHLYARIKQTRQHLQQEIGAEETVPLASAGAATSGATFAPASFEERSAPHQRVGAAVDGRLGAGAAGRMEEGVAAAPMFDHFKGHEIYGDQWNDPSADGDLPLKTLFALRPEEVDAAREAAGGERRFTPRLSEERRSTPAAPPLPPGSSRGAGERVGHPSEKASWNA